MIFVVFEDMCIYFIIVYLYIRIIYNTYMYILYYCFFFCYFIHEKQSKFQCLFNVGGSSGFFFEKITVLFVRSI